MSKKKARKMLRDFLRTLKKLSLGHADGFQNLIMFEYRKVRKYVRKYYKL